MIKKIIIVLVFVLFLNSCFWKATKTEKKIEKNQKVSTKTDIKSKLLTIKWDWFFIKVPKSLVKVTNLPTPRVWKVVLALQSKDMINWFINNFIIIKQILKKPMTSSEFSILNNVKAKTKYENYKKILSKDLIFDDGIKSILYIFEARYNSSTAKQKFLQIWKICDKNKAYILTIWLNKRIFNFDKYEMYLKSFKCN